MQLGHCQSDNEEGQVLTVKVLSAKGLAADASTYAKVLLNDDWLGKTRKVHRTSKPKWKAENTFSTVLDATHIDEQPLMLTVVLAEYSDDVTGRVQIDLNKLLFTSPSFEMARCPKRTVVAHGTREHRGWHAARHRRHAGHRLRTMASIFRHVKHKTLRGPRVYVEVVLTQPKHVGEALAARPSPRSRRESPLRRRKSHQQKRRPATRVHHRPCTPTCPNARFVGRPEDASQFDLSTRGSSLSSCGGFFAEPPATPC